MSGVTVSRAATGRLCHVGPGLARLNRSGWEGGRRIGILLWPKGMPTSFYQCRRVGLQRRIEQGAHADQCCKIDLRRGGSTAGAADGAVEHPRRQIPATAKNVILKMAAQQLPLTPAEYLVNKDDASVPGMPRVKNLTNFSIVGVPASSCITRVVLTWLSVA